MFVMLLKVASSLCGLFFFTFVHVKKPRSSRQFFSHFSRRWISKFLAHRQIENQTLSGKTAQMCMLAWSFSARICVKYLNHMNWYDQFGLSLYLHSFFLVQSAKALARLCECAGSPGLLLLEYGIST